MDSLKPYLSFSFPGPGAKSLLFKKGAERTARRKREMTVEERREFELAFAETRLIGPGTRFDPVDCGGVPCEWISREETRSDRAILYIHGGSWAFGNLRTSRAFGAMLCEATGFRVLVMEYRLAPEFPYPAATEDCSGVYRWLGDNGYPHDRVALFGDSAGGNLCLSLLHRLKALGRPLPAAAGLASPCTDMTEGSVLAQKSGDLLFSQYQGREWDALTLYCGENDRTNPLISPVYGELEGFPPLLIHVGGDEALAVDCDVFARKAHDAGVDVALKIWREMFHDFTIVGVVLKESRQSVAEFGEFFRSRLGGEPAEE